MFTTLTTQAWSHLIEPNAVQPVALHLDFMLQDKLHSYIHTLPVVTGSRDWCVCGTICGAGCSVGCTSGVYVGRFGGMGSDDWHGGGSLFDD